MKNAYPLSRKDNLVIQESDREVLIYDINNHKAFCLNETSAIIWHLCDGTKSLAEISLELGRKLDKPVDEGLVWLALDQLRKENLVDSNVTIPQEYKGLSRREIIKKVGLASMIALPVVASLIAPTKVEAFSCTAPVNRGVGVPCTQSCQCQTLTNPATPQFPGSTPGMCCRSSTPGQTGAMNTCIGPLNTPPVTCFNP